MFGLLQETIFNGNFVMDCLCSNLVLCMLQTVSSFKYRYENFLRFYAISTTEGTRGTFPLSICLELLELNCFNSPSVLLYFLSIHQLLRFLLQSLQKHWEILYIGSYQKSPKIGQRICLQCYFQKRNILIAYKVQHIQC